MTDYLAHIAEDGRQQTVDAHLQGTAALCAQFAAAFEAGAQGELVGLAHDIGKNSPAFQARLLGGRKVDHATAGAIECAKRDALWASLCVAGHHGGLPDAGNLTDQAGDPTLFGRLKKGISGGIPPYQVSLPLPQVPPPAPWGKDGFTDAFFTRMLYSCLVDADYLDTERFMQPQKPARGAYDSLPVLLDRLEAHIQPLWNPESDLNRWRCDILRVCLEGGGQPKGLYTLTVPTGGGKTLASLAFALRHGVRHGMDRILYVIPYTSIIEQTASVFRSILGSENVVEHHASLQYDPVDREEEKADLTQEEYRHALATENWDAPVVVTTAVQLAGRPGHVPSCQDVEVEVEHALSRLLPAVGDYAEVGEAQLLGHFGDDLEAVGHHGGVLRGDLPAGLHVGLGDHQEVGGGLGVDVVEGVHLVVLIDLFRGDLPCDDLAE